MGRKNKNISLTREQIKAKIASQTTSSNTNNANEQINDFDDMHKMLLENHVELMEKFKTIGEKQDAQDNKIEKVLTEFESIQSQLNGSKLTIKEKFNMPNNSNSSISSSVPMKSFMFKYTFKNVANMKEGENMFSEAHEHFGIGWNVEICHMAEKFACYMFCKEQLETGKKKIEAQYEMKIRSKNGHLEGWKSKRMFENAMGWGTNKLIEWKDLEENYLVDGNLTVECHMRIKKMIGIYKENLREFDKTMDDFSDVILIVNDRKFYILSKFLAAHSSYFKAMFLGQFTESSQSEIKLSGIDEDDFQNYLEVLYGHPAIDDYTVEGILLISDMYDTQISTGKCEEFLLERSKKTLKKKLEMAIRYSLEKLKVECLSKLKNMTDVRSVVSGNIHEMDPSLTAALLEKSLSF